jgi:beta-1,4-mannosyl-glycoprotein beta-1,4-N-acetylglucosaminyltransferase
MVLKIIDCFIFYNELELLTYRLNVLNPLVDYFVIVESTHTFTGKEKKLYYNENKNLFENFKEKIIHIVVDDLPYKYPNVNFDNREQWKNEYFQRNAISRGIDNIQLSNDDLIIVSDLDEIPDPSTLDNIKKGDIKVHINAFEMDMYYYNLNTKFNDKWYYSKIMSYKIYKENGIKCNDCRTFNVEIIKQSGWHLSYFGDSNFIKNKIIHFSHQELNTDNFTNISKIEERVKKSGDLYDRNEKIERIEIKNNRYLPPEYDKYLINYFTE